MEENARHNAIETLRTSRKVLYRMALKRMSNQSLWHVHTLILDILPDTWFSDTSVTPIADYNFSLRENIMGNYAFLFRSVAGKDVADWFDKEGVYSINLVMQQHGQHGSQEMLIELPSWIRNENNVNILDYYSYANLLPQLPWPHTLFQLLGNNSSEFDIQDSKPVVGSGFRYNNFNAALWEQIYGVTNRQQSQSFQTSPTIYIRLIRPDGYFHHIQIYRHEVIAEVFGTNLNGAFLHVDHAVGDLADLEIQKPGIYTLPIQAKIELPLAISIYNTVGSTLDLFERSSYISPSVFKHPHVDDHLDEDVQETQVKSELAQESKNLKIDVTKARIFLSHSHKDNTWCSGLHEELSRHGLDIWYDKQELYVGAQWVKTIESELENRDIYLLILTPDSWASEWVKEELSLALTHRKRIVTVIYKQTNVHGFIVNYQMLDVIDQTPSEAAQQIIHALAKANPLVSPKLQEDNSAFAEDDIPPLELPISLQSLGHVVKRYKDTDVILPPLVKIPAGRFLCGWNPEQDPRNANSGDPDQKIAYNEEFWISKYPVTVAEYACAVRVGAIREPIPFGKKGIDWGTQRLNPSYPVGCLTWNAARSYIEWLKEVTGIPWRFPTSLEWEKASRGSDGRIFPWGNTFDPQRANIWRDGIYELESIDAHPDGESPYGVVDMLGGVWEMTSTTRPGNTDDLKKNESRISRGGSYRIPFDYVRITHLNNNQQTWVEEDFGLRLALSSPPDW